MSCLWSVMYICVSVRSCVGHIHVPGTVVNTLLALSHLMKLIKDPETQKGNHFPSLLARCQAKSVWPHSPYNHLLHTKEPGTQLFSDSFNWKKERNWGRGGKRIGAPQKLELKAMVQIPSPKQILVSTAKSFGTNPSQKHIGNLWNATNISSIY